jgi:hypothetical protein
MSVKFEKETIQEAPAQAPIPAPRQETLAHAVGERLTGGDTRTGYLAVGRLATGVTRRRAC